MDVNAIGHRLDQTAARSFVVEEAIIQGKLFSMNGAIANFNGVVTSAVRPVSESYRNIRVNKVNERRLQKKLWNK